MSRYPNESVARFDQQFAETEYERNERWRRKRNNAMTTTPNTNADTTAGADALLPNVLERCYMDANRADQIRLHMGELTSSEMMLAKSAIRYAFGMMARTHAPAAPTFREVTLEDADIIVHEFEVKQICTLNSDAKCMLAALQSIGAVIDTTQGRGG